MGLHVHAIAQPGTCILGDRIHNNLRIINQDGAQNVQCFDCLTNPPNVLLDLIHKYKPVIRLASNFDGGGCLGRSGTLSLHKNDGPRYSQEESEYDLALVASEKINNLLLSTRNHTASIKFATTPELNAPDVERMRITPQGFVGIGEKNPNEILQLWKRMTFHVGFEDDYIGYNVFRDATYKPDGTVDRQFDRLVNVGQPFNAPPLKLGMSRHGYLELGAGAVSGQNPEVDWYEGSGTFDGFAGLTLRNIDGKACASLGKYYPWQDTRLLIRAFTRTTATTNALTNALVVLSSENTDLLRVRNDGNVGIGVESPTARLHVRSGGTSATSNALLVSNSAGSSLLTVREGGKVLIGPSTVSSGTHADFRLSVDGKVVAKSFVATMTGWADYVFEPSYQLMPLDSLEAYITEHRHLPGVPTTQQVTSQGVDVTETMVTLLRKVEELTLYVLELKRENATLRREQTR